MCQASWTEIAKDQIAYLDGFSNLLYVELVLLFGHKLFLLSISDRRHASLFKSRFGLFCGSHSKFS